MEILQTVMDTTSEKTIIFSQFTSLLDLLEVPILEKNWDFKRYDGSMTSTARNEAVEEFTEKPNCRIMLVSLKAGNSGLNLVAASQVIILDPFWNPYIEEQAIDRAHRIGQLRPVHVHRVLVPETVEDRILALQEQKRAVIEGALDEKASENIGRLDTRQLAFLFVSIPVSCCIASTLTTSIRAFPTKPPDTHCFRPTSTSRNSTSLTKRKPHSAWFTLPSASIITASLFQPLPTDVATFAPAVLRQVSFEEIIFLEIPPCSRGHTYGMNGFYGWEVFFFLSACVAC